MDTAYQLLQLLLHLAVLVTGMLLCVTISWSVNTFRGCVLGANMSLQVGVNGSLYLESADTRFGAMNTCWYNIFVGILATLYGIFWLWHYLLHRGWSLEVASQKGSKKKTRFFVFPVILCSVLLVAAFVAGGYTSSGITTWCRLLRPSPLDKEHPSFNPGARLTCSQLASNKWMYPERGKEGYWLTRTAELCSWLLTAVLAALVVTLVVWFRESVIRWYAALRTDAAGKEFDRQFKSESGYQNPNYETMNETKPSLIKQTSIEGSKPPPQVSNKTPDGSKPPSKAAEGDAGVTTAAPQAAARPEQLPLGSPDGARDQAPSTSSVSSTSNPPKMAMS